MYMATQFRFGEEIEDTARENEMDKIDALFNRLEVIAPPVSLVEDILAKVAKLPRYGKKETEEVAETVEPSADELMQY